jgi:hypothetical protein
VNSTEARLLIQKYNLTQLPAILFSPEASAYLSFDSTWIGTNNTIEQDGWYVFRNYDLLGYGYQNLTG